MKNDLKIVARKGCFAIFIKNLGEELENLLAFVIDIREVIDLHNEVIVEKIRCEHTFYFFLKEGITEGIDEYLENIAKKHNLDYTATK